MLAGAAVAGSSLAAADPSRPGNDHVVRQLDQPRSPRNGTAQLPGVTQVSAFHPAAR